MFEDTEERKENHEWLVRMEDMWSALEANKGKKVTLVMTALYGSARFWWEGK